MIARTQARVGAHDHCGHAVLRLRAQTATLPWHVCRRASAHTITAVVPYYGYARADRKVHGRESIAAKLTANLLTEAGIDRMLSIDLHSGQCVGYFDIPVDHVYGESVLLDYLASKQIPNGVPPQAAKVHNSGWPLALVRPWHSSWCLQCLESEGKVHPPLV
jgi:N-terminal domain of ribose phosphate pyrophosphokinase